MFSGKNNNLVSEILRFLYVRPRKGTTLTLAGFNSVVSINKTHSCNNLPHLKIYVAKLYSFKMYSPIISVI